MDSHTWDAALNAYGASYNAIADWQWLLSECEEWSQIPGLLKGIAYHIQHRLWEAATSITDDLIDRAEQVMARAWNASKAEKTVPSDTYRNWLTAAINDVGGWIAEFWVRYCDYQQKRLGKTWAGIPERLKPLIVEALGGDDRPSVHARIALTPWMSYFLTWDREFSVNHVLPILDWERDPVVAQQSWSVLLNYKRGTTVDLESLLIPYYRQFASRVKGLLKDTTENANQFDQQALGRLGFCLAGIAMEVEDNPVESQFFREFLPLLPDEIRMTLAIGIGNYLRRYDEDRRTGIWTTWLHVYLKQRFLGIPTALSTAETDQMLEWCLHLRPVFEEAVDCISKMHRNKVFAHGIIEELKNSPLLRSCNKTYFPGGTIRSGIVDWES